MIKEEDSASNLGTNIVRNMAGNENRAYTVEQWTADIALIKVAYRKVHEDNLHQDLRGILQESDKYFADAALRILKPTARTSA